MERQDVSSTSKAAEVVSKESAGCAAIASRFAAEYHGLDVLEANIEDKLDNTTRFLVLRNVRSERTRLLLLEDDKAASTAATKTLISFTIYQDSPGALADALSVFKTHGVNLTSINTRPSRRRPWDYIFFVECGGHFAGGNKEVMAGLLKELRGIVEVCRDLGTWRDQHRLEPLNGINGAERRGLPAEGQ